MMNIYNRVTPGVEPIRSIAECPSPDEMVTALLTSAKQGDPRQKEVKKLIADAEQRLRDRYPQPTRRSP